jgi:hypothetical protein
MSWSSSVRPFPMKARFACQTNLPLPVHGERYQAVSALRPVWYAMILSDEASFYQHMSTARYHLDAFRGQTDHTKAVLYYLRAIRSVNRRWSDPVQAITDQLIGSVITFLTV